MIVNMRTTKYKEGDVSCPARRREREKGVSSLAAAIPFSEIVIELITIFVSCALSHYHVSLPLFTLTTSLPLRLLLSSHPTDAFTSSPHAHPLDRPKSNSNSNSSNSPRSTLPHLASSAYSVPSPMMMMMMTGTRNNQTPTLAPL